MFRGGHCCGMGSFMSRPTQTSTIEPPPWECSPRGGDRRPESRAQTERCRHCDFAVALTSSTTIMAQASSSTGPLYPVKGFNTASLKGATLVIVRIGVGAHSLVGNLPSPTHHAESLTRPASCVARKRPSAHGRSTGLVPPAPPRWICRARGHGRTLRWSGR